MDKHINEIAYQIAKENFGDQVFAFNDLWAKVVKQIKVPTKEQPVLKGELYSEIIQDTNFLYVGKQNWRLREFVSQADLKKNLASSLYDFDKSLSEEDYDQIDTLTERFDEESGMYFDENEDEIYQNVKDMASIEDDEEEGDME